MCDVAQASTKVDFHVSIRLRHHLKIQLFINPLPFFSLPRSLLTDSIAKMEFYRENASATSSSSSPSLLLFLLFLLLSPSPSQANDSKSTENKEQKKLTLNAVERGIGITGFHSRWEALTSWAKLASMNLRPPDSSESANPFCFFRILYISLTIRRSVRVHEFDLFAF